MLTLEQKIFVVQCYGLGQISYKGVVRHFEQQFPGISISDVTVKSIATKFSRTGTVENRKKKKRRLDEDDAATVLALGDVRANGKISLRRRAAELGVSKSHLQRIFKINKIIPYKPKFCHTLEPNDEGKRLDFCLWIGEKCLTERNFENNIIFSDEASFTTNGVVSSQNCRYWSDENPNFRINCRRQYSKKVNVWCAVSYDGIIGPYFLDGNLNQYAYLEILQNYLQNYLNEMNLAKRQKIYYQQDGCSAHSTLLIRNYLDNTFGEKWIGRFGPQPYPPRSPDLTIMDFYFWGKLKQQVYTDNFDNDLERLKNKITDVIRAIPLEEIRRSYKEFRKRVELCSNLGGALFE